MEFKIDRTYGDQTPKVSLTRGIKSPPLSLTIATSPAAATQAQDEAEDMIAN